MNNDYPTFPYDPVYFRLTPEQRRVWVLNNQTSVVGTLGDPIVIRKSQPIPDDIRDEGILDDAMRHLFDTVILTTMLAVQERDNGRGRYIVRVLPGRFSSKFRLVGVAYQLW